MPRYQGVIVIDVIFFVTVFYMAWNFYNKCIVLIIISIMLILLWKTKSKLAQVSICVTTVSWTHSGHTSFCGWWFLCLRTLYPPKDLVPFCPILFKFVTSSLPSIMQSLFLFGCCPPLQIALILEYTQHSTFYLDIYFLQVFFSKPGRIPICNFCVFSFPFLTSTLSIAKNLSWHSTNSLFRRQTSINLYNWWAHWNSATYASLSLGMGAVIFNLKRKIRFFKKILSNMIFFYN